MLESTTLLQIFKDGRWHDAATLEMLGPDRCRIDYLPQYQFSDSPAPLSLSYPLDATPDVLVTGGDGLEGYERRIPGFLYDLAPQGKGRSFLLKMLGLADDDHVVMPLLMAGAFNPIGHLRVKSAVDFYVRNVDPGVSAGGFSLEDILQKSEDFLEHLSMHAMLAAGTTGVQGVAPKYLLAQDADGRWFADLALSDDLAVAHWLVKLPRGRSDDDRRVLRNEAAYLRVAHAAGLRTNEPPMLHNEMLFVRRFDRLRTESGLERLHQESVASLAGIRGFGVPMSMNEMLQVIRLNVSDPLAEAIEFLKRDVLNVALRNTDNHARNTAVQVLPSGHVQLTPVFDFSPMFMDPEVVPRTSHWMGRDGKTRLQDYREVIDLLAEDLPEDEVAVLAKELQDFAQVVGRLPSMARDQGVEPFVLEQCLPAIERVAKNLSEIAGPPVAQAIRNKG